MPRFDDDRQAVQVAPDVDRVAQGRLASLLLFAQPIVVASAVVPARTVYHSCGHSQLKSQIYEQLRVSVLQTTCQAESTMVSL